MDLPFIQQLIDIFSASDAEQLDYADGHARLQLFRSAPMASSEDALPAPIRASEAAPVTVVASPSTTHTHTVRAGLVGTFFKAPSPDQPPFVKVGDRVEEGQTLGIVEAMKMLNDVEADRAGRMLEVRVSDGAAVEAGTPLFILDCTPDV